MMTSPVACRASRVTATLPAALAPPASQEYQTPQLTNDRSLRAFGGLPHTCPGPAKGTPNSLLPGVPETSRPGDGRQQSPAAGTLQLHAGQAQEATAATVRNATAISGSFGKT